MMSEVEATRKVLREQLSNAERIAKETATELAQAQLAYRRMGSPSAEVSARVLTAAKASGAAQKSREVIEEMLAESWRGGESE